MPRAKRLAVNSFIRSQVRGLIRTNPKNDDVFNSVKKQFPSANKNELRSVIATERARQDGIDKIFKGDKRRNVDLGKSLKCNGPEQTLTASIEIFFPDDAAGGTRRFQGFVTLAKVGRLANIVNDALATVVANAANKGYTPADVTSAMTTGSVRYNVNYVECE